MALSPGIKLGPYEILATLASDSSESYKAADPRLNRTVTLKLYPAQVWSDSATKQRLEREIRTLAGLKHRYICAPCEVLHDEAGFDYLVTEYFQGETLAELEARTDGVERSFKSG